MAILDEARHPPPVRRASTTSTYRPPTSNIWWTNPGTVNTPDRVRIGVSSNAAINASPAVQALRSGGYPVNNASIRTAGSNLQLSNRAGSSPSYGLSGSGTSGTGSSGYRGGYGGGGGGGGGGGAAGLTQAQLDWLTSMLGAAKPKAQVASILDLPEFQQAFNSGQFDTLRTGLESALGQDRATANQSTQNLVNFLTSNYQNAFTNPNNTYATAGQAPGASQDAMARMLQSQGVNPSIMGEEAQGRAAADQAFGNLWRSQAATEDQAQGNRLTNAQIANQDVMNRINAFGLQGRTGIGLQESQARTAHEQMVAQRNWETQQQEAMQNWQRANQVSDINAQNANSFTNQQLQTMLGLLPQLGKLNLPTLQALGMA